MVNVLLISSEGNNMRVTQILEKTFKEFKLETRLSLNSEDVKTFKNEGMKYDYVIFWNPKSLSDISNINISEHIQGCISVIVQSGIKNIPGYISLNPSQFYQRGICSL